MLGDELDRTLYTIFNSSANIDKNDMRARAVQRLDGVGGVDNLLDLRWVGEETGHCCPR
jgi:hypothetical protein